MEAMPNYKRCAMGDIIKFEYGKIHNLTYEEIEANKTIYRTGLIELGNWGRSKSPDFWIKKIIAQKGNIIVTDVRLKHELDVFRQTGAIAIRIESDREIRKLRGGELVAENDITETDLDNIQNWDFVIYNNSNFEFLREKILQIVAQIN